MTDRPKTIYPLFFEEGGIIKNKQTMKLSITLYLFIEKAFIKEHALINKEMIIKIAYLYDCTAIISFHS